MVIARVAETTLPFRVGFGDDGGCCSISTRFYPFPFDSQVSRFNFKYIYIYIKVGGFLAN